MLNRDLQIVEVENRCEDTNNSLTENLGHSKGIQESLEMFKEELHIVDVVKDENEFEDTDSTLRKFSGDNEGIQETVETLNENLDIENKPVDKDQFLGRRKGTEESVEKREVERLVIENDADIRSPVKKKKRKVNSGLGTVSKQIEPFEFEWRHEDDTETLFYKIDILEVKNVDLEDELDKMEVANLDYYKTSQKDDAEKIALSGNKAGDKRAAGPYKRELQCRLCPMTFVLPLNLVKHIKKMHNVNKKPKQAALDLEMDQETREKKEDQHIVILVDEETQETTSTKEPKGRKDAVKVIQEHRCPHCGACFTVRKSLMRHMKHSKCADNQYPCEQCQKVFLSLQKLRAHMLTHLEQFACDLCDQAFAVASELSKHKADKHDVKTKHQCTECKKVLSTKGNLKHHMRTHSGEKPFVCSLCGKSFSQKCNLQLHLMRHNQIKPFECKECLQRFVRKFELTKHARSHTAAKSFVCNICKASFDLSSSLATHERIHTGGEEPFQREFWRMLLKRQKEISNRTKNHMQRSD